VAVAVLVIVVAAAARAARGDRGTSSGGARGRSKDGGGGSGGGTGGHDAGAGRGRAGRAHGGLARHAAGAGGHGERRRCQSIPHAPTLRCLRSALAHLTRYPRVTAACRRPLIQPGRCTRPPPCFRGSGRCQCRGRSTFRQARPDLRRSRSWSRSRSSPQLGEDMALPAWGAPVPVTQLLRSVAVRNGAGAGRPTRRRLHTSWARRPLHPLPWLGTSRRRRTGSRRRLRTRQGEHCRHPSVLSQVSRSPVPARL
jgi:hypothetical protein